jgi:hypothetical protein
MVYYMAPQRGTSAQKCRLDCCVAFGGTYGYVPLYNATIYTSIILLQKCIVLTMPIYHATMAEHQLCTVYDIK